MVEMAWLRFGYEDPVIATACVRSVERERLKQSAPQSAGRRSTLRVLLCKHAWVLIHRCEPPLSELHEGWYRRKGAWQSAFVFS